jgi:GlpG protein
MRKLASFEDRELAHMVRDVLRAEDIECETRENHEDHEAVWVLDAAKLEGAQRILDEVRADPQHPRFTAARERLAKERAVTLEAEALRTRSRPTREVRKVAPAQDAAPISLAIFLVCAATALLTTFGKKADIVSALRISGFEREPFRLLTPIFLHFGPFHLLFNMFWLLDLGVTLERHIGAARYALLIVISAIASNLAQLYFGPGPNFGGMSGVIYAFVGYLWMRGKFDPHGELRAPPRLVSFFVLWMALGFTSVLEELFGAMANYCHLGGFVSGSFAGYVAARRAKHGLRR